jgi:2-dehydropantoate 2-reductase
MRTAIVGAGAIGGLIGWRLAKAGHEVALLARGATLQALRRHELVVVALKAQALPALAPALAPLVGPDTIVLSAMNGVPWWFFHRFGGACEGLVLQSVDPGGAIARALPPAQTVGGVVHLSAVSPQPGVVEHRAGERLIVGAVDAAPVRPVAELLEGAGFAVETAEPVQREVWFKLWGNMTMNPLSAITGATTDRILDDDLVRAFASRCMEEAKAIGERIGIPIASTPQERHAVTRKLGAMRTSMLQDVDAGKPLELDAIVGAVREIAQHLAMPTPAIDTLLGLARLHARVRGLYPQ